MKFIKSSIVIVLLCLTTLNTDAHEVAVIDYDFLLSQSKPAKIINTQIKKIEEKYSIKFKDTEQSLKKEEKSILSKKNILDESAYLDLIMYFNVKVNKYNTDKDKSLLQLKKKNIEAKKQLIKDINPIISDYMQNKSFALVISKKSIIISKSELDITMDIIKIIDKKITKPIIN